MPLGNIALMDLEGLFTQLKNDYIQTFDEHKRLMGNV